MRSIFRTVCWFSLTLSASAVFADAGTQLKVFPAEISLNGQDDRQSLAVQLVNDQGITRDVSSAVVVKAVDANIVDVSGQMVKPKADGQTKLLVELGQHTAEVTVSVKNAIVSRNVSFRLDVMPIFMKAGCNSGSCHGAARGKDGFMLSLFGYDPVGDYYRLTRQLVGRRINLAVPEKSLLLEKPAGQVTHTGGKLFTPESDDYRTILRWIEAGAPDDTGDTPEPLSLELLPAKIVFAGKDHNQKTVVTARYSDGTVRDVTQLALFMTNNDAVVSIDKDGLVKGNNRGGAFVFARFNKFTVGAEVLVLPTDDNFVWPGTPESNYIDMLVFDKLKKLHLAPSELCDDETFLRRVTLDLIGLPPTRDEYDQFIADTDTEKRAKLVDRLLEREEFVDLWAMKWGELLRIRAVGNQPQYGRDSKAMWAYAAWVHDQMAVNRPLNEMVADLVVGRGSNIKQPTSNLYTSNERLTPQKTAEDFAQVFMGTRIQCAQCHNHPFDRWTLDDYYGFAGFFAGVNMKRGVEGREVVIFNNDRNNTVEHPVNGQRMKPKFLGGDAPDVDGQDPRVSLSKWLTAPENTAFNQTMANIIWAHFFGRGIVDPVDDVRISNPPSNKELLDSIGKKLAEYGFDKKKLIRDICNSRTYQLSAATNPTNELDQAYFSHSYVRRLQAEVLLDTITSITGTEDRFQSSPQGTRAVELYAGNVTNFFLTTFGRAPRESACSCEVNKEANLSQALHLVNGDTITLKVATSRVIPNLLAAKLPPEKIIEDLYILALSRKPTADETTALVALVTEDLNNPDRVDKLAGLRAQLDQAYRRLEEQLKGYQAEYEKLKDEGQEPEALVNLEKQIAMTEKQMSDARTRQAGSVPLMVYGDILWGLFNSTEFAFNH